MKLLKILILIGVCSTLWAPLYAVDPFSLKGTHRVLRPEYEYLSPLHGCNLVQNHTIENLHQLGDQQDKTIALIQNCFQYTAGNLALTNYSSNPVRYFSINTISRILARLSLDSNSAHLKSDLTDLIWAEIGPKSTRQPVELLLSQYGTQIAHCAESKKDHKTVQFMFDSIQNILEHLPSGSVAKLGSGVKLVHNELKLKSVEEFVELLLAATAESRPPHQKYPPHFAEQILLGVLCKKANRKADFLPLFRGVPHALKANLFAQPELDRWLSDNGSKEEYHLRVTEFETMDEKSLGGKRPHDLLNPETASLMFTGYRLSRKLPPLASFGSAAHSSLRHEKVIQNRKHSDCGETAVRNFFNIVLRSGDHLNIGFLLNHPKLHPKKELIEFYQNHNSLEELENDDLRDEWSEKVISRIQSPRVIYNRPAADPVCDMRGGMQNMLAVVENLLFMGNAEFQDLKKPSEKWNYLCQALSRDGFELALFDQGRVDDLDHGLALGFTINDEPAFEWEFLERHFDLRDKTDQALDWRTKAGKAALLELPEGELTSASLGALSNYLTLENLEDLLTGLRSRPMARHQLAMGLPLKSDEIKVKLVKAIMSHQLHQDYSLALKLISLLPRDMHTFQNLLETALISKAPFTQDLIKIVLDLAKSPKDKDDFIKKALKAKTPHLIELLHTQEFRAAQFDIPAAIRSTHWANFRAINRMDWKLVSSLLPIEDCFVKDKKGNFPLHEWVKFYRYRRENVLHHVSRDENEKELASLREDMKIMAEKIISSDRGYLLQAPNSDGKAALEVLKEMEPKEAVDREFIEYLAQMEKKGMKDRPPH